MEMQEMTERLVKVEQRERSNSHRIDAMEKQQEVIHRLATSMEVMATEQKSMSKQLTEVIQDVKDLSGEPGKKWRFVVEKAIYIVVAAVIGFVLAKLGLA